MVDFFEATYMVLYITAMIGRASYAKKTKKIEVIISKRKAFEWSLLVLGSLMMILPLVYIFTGYIDQYNFILPLWLRILGLASFALAVFLHNWTHKVLGVNWSPRLEIKKNQKLITSGPYNYVRHPMYAAFLLWSISQGIVLPNSFLIVVSILSMGIVYFSRVNAEEQLMIEQFGNEYIKYMKKTGRIIPKI